MHTCTYNNMHIYIHVYDYAYVLPVLRRSFMFDAVHVQYMYINQLSN